MDLFQLNRIVYNISGCIQTVQTYIEQFPTYTVYPPGGPNPISEADYDDNIDLTLSGYAEDYGPIKEQLGYSGVVWSTDYEFHIEESTKALLSPIVGLKELVNDSLTEIENGLNLIVAQVNSCQNPKKIFIRVVGTDYNVEYEDGFDGTLDHWPEMVFLGLDANNTYVVDPTYLRVVSIVPTFVDGVPTAPFNIVKSEYAQLRSSREGIILVR